MEAITAQGFGRFECEMLTLGELEAFGEPLKKVLSVSAGDSGLDAAGPHTSVVISYLRHLERAYPRLWTKKNGTPGALDGTMPVSPAGSPPSTPRGVSSSIVRFDSVVSDESGSSSAAAELGEQWLSTYEETKIAFNQLVAGDASDLASLHESLQWLVGVAPQIKALIAEENNMTK